MKIAKKHLLISGNIIPFLLFLLLTLFNVTSSSAEKTIKQTTTGDQSPAVVGETITINYHNYGLSKETFDKLVQAITAGIKESLRGKEDTIATLNRTVSHLLKNLDEKNVAIEQRDATIRQIIEKQKELETRLEKRSPEDTLTAQAKEKLKSWDLEGAETLLKESLSKNLEALTEKRKAAASDAYELGSLKELQLEYREARDYYEKAVQLEPKNSDYLNQYGYILDKLGESKKAIEYYEKALKIDIEVYGDKHPNVATRYNNIGAAWIKLGDSKKAIDYFETALKIGLAVYGDKHPDVAASYYNIGSALVSLEEYKKAIEYYEKSLQIGLEAYGVRHPNVARIYNNIRFSVGPLRGIQKGD